jgi:hypothetical protein
LRLTSVEQNLSGEGLGTDGELAAQAATDVFVDHELGRPGPQAGHFAVALKAVDLLRAGVAGRSA